MKKSIGLYLLLVLAGATFASATTLPVILNPDFTPSGASLLQVQGNNNPDSWDDDATPNVPDWNFKVITFGPDNTLNLSGIAGPDLTPGSGETQDYIEFTAPPDGASQFAFLSSGSYVDQLVTGFQTGKAYILTFSAESYCPAIDPITVTFNGLDAKTEYPSTGMAFSDPQSGWETFSVGFTANSSSEYINFSTTIDNGNFPLGYDLNSSGPFVALSDPVIAATPEPGSLLLFATGLLGLIFMVQMRSRKNSA